ncbi:SpaA isopeptide-forming pilin-related protein [Corynebacterium sp. H113]|uniref:SpaA isopeptide-forming pilin-related protein n=1 Tax=Corynebacterium sp. H113 TaxID=3133419 RepID=UPI003096A9EC
MSSALDVPAAGAQEASSDPAATSAEEVVTETVEAPAPAPAELPVPEEVPVREEVSAPVEVMAPDESPVSQTPTPAETTTAEAPADLSGENLDAELPDGYRRLGDSQHEVLLDSALIDRVASAWGDNEWMIDARFKAVQNVDRIVVNFAEPHGMKPGAWVSSFFLGDREVKDVQAQWFVRDEQLVEITFAQYVHVDPGQLLRVVAKDVKVPEGKPGAEAFFVNFQTKPEVLEAMPVEEVAAIAEENGARPDPAQDSVAPAPVAEDPIASPEIDPIVDSSEIGLMADSMPFSSTDTQSAASSSVAAKSSDKVASPDIALMADTASTCVDIKGTSWTDNSRQTDGSTDYYGYYNYYDGQDISFTSGVKGTINQLTLAVNHTNPIYPSSHPNTTGYVYDASGNLVKTFSWKQITWVRSGNNMVFTLPAPVAVDPGYTVKIRVWDVPDGNIYPTTATAYDRYGYLYEYTTGKYTSGVVSACGSLPTGTAVTAPSYLTQPLPNPAAQPRCGQKIALVFDVSNSIGATGLTNIKRAGTEIINKLAGTPTQLGVYNFATDAPADGNSTNWSHALDLGVSANVTTLNTKVNNLHLATNSQRGGTNWEGGIGEAIGQGYDIVYVITDGEPTAYEGSSDVGYTTHVSDIDRAIKAANLLKKAGTRVETIGVGMKPTADVYNDNSSFRETRNTLDMLTWISGPKENEEWYRIADYSTLASMLSKRILAACESSLIVNKQVRLLDGTLIDGGNWEFNATAIPGALKNTSDPVQHTDAEGSAFWKFELVNPNQIIDPNNPPKSPVLVKETQQAGYSLELQNGQRATCTRWNKPLASANDPNSATGFSVNVDVYGPVVCTVINKQLPDVHFALKKVGFVDGEQVTQPLEDAKFDIRTVNPDGTMGDPAMVAGKPAQLVYDATSMMYRSPGLVEGDYYILETQSPAGFSLLPKPIKIRVTYERNASGILVLDSAGNPKSIVTILNDDNTVPAAVEYVKSEGSRDNIVITLANYQVGDLPKTGGIGFGPILLAAFGLIGAAVVTRKKMTT